MAKKYSTTFAASEDPLSESGVWQARINTILTDMKSVAATGRASAKALGVADYDDSAALLTGYAADTEITATVFKDPTINTGANHELELLGRATQSTTISLQYESLFRFNGNIQCFRWFDTGTGQDFEGQTPLYGSESLGRDFVTGDRIRQRVAGSFIIMSVIDGGGSETTLGVYNNGVLTSGQPGIGGFIRSLDGADALKFCFNDAQISDIFSNAVLATDNFTRANETPLSGGGNWATGADLASLDLVSNKVQNHTADTDSGMRYVALSFYICHWAEITIDTVGGGDFGPAVCMQASGDCIGCTNYNGSTIYLFSRIAGSFNLVDNAAGSYAPGDVIVVAKFGSFALLYKNSTLLLTITMTATELIGGSPGIFSFDGTNRISAFRAGRVNATYDAVPGSSTVNNATLTSNVVETDGFISSVSRGRNNADSFTIADNTLPSATRGVTLSESLTVTDNAFFTFLRGLVVEDDLTLTDEIRYALIRNRLHEDNYVLTDGFISSLTASQIITLIASSLVVFSDEDFLFLLRNLSASDLVSMADGALASVERNAFGSDSISITDQGQSQMSLTRQLSSQADFADSSFNFQLLTRRLESALVSSDASISSIFRNTPALIDGSKIQIGFSRPSIVLGSNNLVRIQ